MKKHLLVSAMVLFVAGSTMTAAFAQNGFQKGLKNVGNGISQDSKSIFNDFKSSVKKDAENTVTQKSQIKELKQQKEDKLKPIDDSITIKKREIDKVKKADYMTETEKTAKLVVLNKQLKYLEIKKANVQKIYGDKIDAIK